MTIIKGNGGGLEFRVIFLPDGTHFGKVYYFEITPDGAFAFRVSGYDISIKAPHSQILAQQSYSSAIKTGLGQTNLPTVIARGSDIHLFINKQYVAHVNDSTSNAGAKRNLYLYWGCLSRQVNELRGLSFSRQ